MMGNKKIIFDGKEVEENNKKAKEAYKELLEKLKQEKKEKRA